MRSILEASAQAMLRQEPIWWKSPTSKKNSNPQFGKRKTTFDEPSPEIKLLQDLKSENGNMRALLTTIIDHLGINEVRKHKGQDDMTKQAKTHAALANSKGLIGKPKKSTQKPKGAILMPRRYLASENSSESESSGNESPVQNAMFARVQGDPMPELSVQSIFWPKSRPTLDTSKTR
jgi:hypothetical protein